MTDMHRLVPTDSLKITRLAEAGKGRAYLHYDPVFDALMILFVSPDTETVVHYVDDHVALLYEPETREVVGLQVEAFERSFVPRHDAVRRVWRLSEATDTKIEDLGDMIFAVEARTPEVTREVVRASAPALGSRGQELVAALAGD